MTVILAFSVDPTSRKAHDVHGNGTAMNRMGGGSGSPANATERMSETPRGSRTLRGLLVATDVTAVAIAWIASTMLRVRPGANGLWSVAGLGFVPIAVAVTTAAIAANKLYRARVCSVRALELSTMLRACVIAGAILTFIADRLRADGLSIRRIVIGDVFAFALVMIGRSLYRSGLRSARAAGRHAWRVVLVGTGDEAFDLHRLLADNAELGPSALLPSGATSRLPLSLHLQA